MKIGIVGLGVVGSAIKVGFEELGHEVKFHDVKLDTQLSDVLDTEICYICVPTESMADGKCDVSIVRGVVESLGEYVYKGIVAIKSTVEPGTTDSLLAQLPGLEICFTPEFLRGRCAVSDFMDNNDVLAVGTYTSTIYDKVVSSHGGYTKSKVMLKPVEAELLKYFSNSYNAMRIIFANEFYEVCKELGADYEKVKDAFQLKRYPDDKRNSYLEVNDNMRGFGGACLPKDVAALAVLVKELDLDMRIFERILEENAKFKVIVLEGMRKEI